MIEALFKIIESSNTTSNHFIGTLLSIFQCTKYEHRLFTKVLRTRAKSERHVIEHQQHKPFVHINELFAHFSETVLILAYQSSESVRKMFSNGRDESLYNRKHIRKYSDKKSHIAFPSLRLRFRLFAMLSLSLP